MEYLITAFICLIASVFGAICGIGGGVIIKPSLDAMGLMPVSTISFLSGVTVLCMSTYSVLASARKHELSGFTKNTWVLSLGAALGGVTGKQMFDQIKNMLGNAQMIGSIQAAVLFLLTFGTLLYTIKKKSIITKQVENLGISLTAGLLLGIMSSFLGIGGGPFNLIVLNYLFSMDAKTSARTSLLIIMCSQMCGIAVSVMQKSVPEFSVLTLVIMASMGICGGIIGRVVNRKIDNDTVDKLFIGMIAVIMLICVYNFQKYL